MNEDEFWAAIALTGGKADEADLDRLGTHLRGLTAQDILGFQDRLSEVLWRMDLVDVARQPWRDVSEPDGLPRIPGISADGFLYARCAAVLQGRRTVEAILADPAVFERRWDTGAESLLYLAEEAWQAATGAPFDEDREGPYSYETGSNPAGGWD
jgi:hypothetical protein